MRYPLLVAVALLAATSVVQAQAPASGKKLFFPACQPFQVDLKFDCYHTYDEQTAFLREAARQYPGLARLESMGKSYQGRDLWVLTITDFTTGDPLSKPAMWVDGGIDADEVVAIEAALGLIHRLLTSNDPKIQELRRTRTFYVAPSVIPDVSDVQHTSPIRPRDTTMRPWDDDNDGTMDEDGPEDLDGDGQAIQMRVEDPAGNMVRDARDPRIMRQRRPDDTGPFYRLYPEGTDNDGDGRFGEDPFGGVDPNRNYPGNWSVTQGGAGPYPGSEPELRAMLDFMLAHPNIAASQHYHSSGGVILRPPSVPDMDLPEADEQLFLAISREGLEVTGYNLATSVYDWNWPRGSRNNKPTQVWRNREGRITTTGGDNYGSVPGEHAPGEHSYPAYGGSIDGMYLLFGVLAFANEIYQMGTDENGDGVINPAEQMAYNDRVLKGEAFAPWRAFDHPQLGRVEIGGWRKFGQNNPLPRDLPREVQRNVDFAILQAGYMPLLRIDRPAVQDLGGGVYRVRATVRNAGLQPTELAIRHQQNRAIPVRAALTPGAGVELLSEEARQDLGTIQGYGEARVDWLVRAPQGGEVTVSATHPKGGTTSATIQLR